MERVTVSIAGMSCGHCVHTVTKALKSLDGVTVEKVSIGSATVSYDPSVTTVEQITRAVDEAGYQARPAAQAVGGTR
jgi:copper chaperone